MKNKKGWIIAAVAAVIVIGAAVWLLRPAEEKPPVDPEAEKPQQEQTEQTQQPPEEETQPEEESQTEIVPEEETQVEPPVSVETEEKMVLPYAIPDTTLVIESLNSYDGVYLEDGSDAKAKNVLSMVVRNTGRQCVEYAEILLRGEEGEYHFHVSGLDREARVVVQALEMAKAEEQDYQGAAAQVAVIDEFDMAE